MAGVFDDEIEQTVTIDEYLDKVEAEELEADLVLGGDEGKECTYGMGYMKRQAIFSCLTCVPDGNAGVCTACSLSCHDGHEIVELWTKRNFRCDCGNSKFGASYCKLCPNKDIENAENSYNHNFKGVYCTCERPYPDPNVEEQEEMMQCIMCEDWFHEEHLGLESSHEIPKDEEGEPLYEDFICKTCSESCSFLALYPRSIWAESGQSGGANVNTCKDKGVMGDVSASSGLGKIDNENPSHSSVKDIAVVSANSESISIEKTSATGESSEKSIELNQCSNLHIKCLLGADAVVTAASWESKPLFLPKNWRDALCRCERCLDMYNQKHVNYLLDKEDSIAEYEKVAKQKRDEKLQQQEGAEFSFLNKLGHVEKMEILNGIADFKDEFRSFLESFDTSKAVTSSHIEQIFENLVKKRRRLQ